MEWEIDQPLKFKGVSWQTTDIKQEYSSNELLKLTINFVGFYEPKPQEEPTMNRSTTVFLVDNSVKALRARYEDGGKEEIFKTFDNSILKDDILVVESGTRHGFTTVKVTETDVTIDIDDSSIIVKWVVQRINFDDHKNILAQEAAAIDKVRVAEFNKKKRDLIANMASPEDAEALRNIKVNPAQLEAPRSTV